MKHRLLFTAFASGLIAGLVLASLGCAGMVKQHPITADTVQDQQGIANVATGDVTGLSYQSVLPAGVAILLGLIVVIQTGANSFEDLLLHRQQMAKMKNGGVK
jgi:hypothetical protein